MPAWELADARREILEVRAENLDLRTRVQRLEEFVHKWIMGANVDAPPKESHDHWDFGEELEGTQRK